MIATDNKEEDDDNDNNGQGNVFSRRLDSVMVSVLVPRSSSLGSNSGRGHCVVFLGKTLYSHSASLHPGV